MNGRAAALALSTSASAQAVRIDERQDAIAETALGRSDRRAVALEPRAPVVEAVGRDREGDLGGEAVSAPRRRHLGPGEEGEVGPRAALGVGVEEVVGAGVVLVDALLDQPHAEHAGVEVEVLLRRTGDGGDVVQAARASGLLRSATSFSSCCRAVRKPAPKVAPMGQQTIKH